MIEATLGFLAGFFFNYTALITIFVLGAIFTHLECNKLAATALLGSVVVFSVLWSLPTIYVVSGVIIYIIAGVLWSLHKYKQMLLKAEKEGTSLTQLKPSLMATKLTSIAILWPLSLPSSLVGSLISWTQGVVAKVFNKVYNNSVFKSEFTK